MNTLNKKETELLLCVRPTESYVMKVHLKDTAGLYDLLAYQYLTTFPRTLMALNPKKAISDINESESVCYDMNGNRMVCY